MIVRSKEQGKVFPVVPWIKFMLLQSGEKMMPVLVEITEGSTVPEHNHPHEQMGI